MTITAYDTRAEIETPESVILTFDIAGPGSRMGAYLADLVIRFVVLLGLNWLIAIALPVFGEAIPLGFLLLSLFLLEWGYGAVFEGLFRGQTPGKWMFRLRVI